MKRWRLDLALSRLVGAVFSPWRRRKVQRDQIIKPVGKPVTLITGATGGIGEAIALRLGAAGHNLLLTGRNEDQLLDLAKEIKGKADVVVMTLALDLSDKQAHLIIDELCEAQAVYIDVLINNAGLAEKRSFLNNDPALIETVIDIDITVLTRLMRHYLPSMIARARGAVINVSSIGGLAPGPYQSVYYASKAYVTSLTEAVAHEVRGQGVYVGTILPGPTKSAFHDRANGRGSLYLKFFGQMAAVRVALTIERALLSRHWPLLTPGPFYMIIAFCMRVIPGSLLTPVLGILYKQKRQKRR